MAASLLLACGLNEPELPAFTLLREETDIDASFLVTCILGQRTKVQSTGTVLLCLHHAFQHYVGAAVRLGFNLQAARDKGALHVIEPLSEAIEMLRIDADRLLDDLWLQVRTAVAALQLPESTGTSARRRTCTIVLDDVTALIDVGVPERVVLQFCRQLVQWANGTAAGDNAGGAAGAGGAGRVSVVLKVSVSNLYEHLVANLGALADSEVRCERLRSGNFCEVDGRLASVRYARPDRRLEAVRKTVLYKVNERNVKIFAPGEVGIRI